MTSDLSTDKAQASGGRSSRDVALEVPKFVDVVVAKSQCVYPSATNPCCERVGKEEQFSTVLQASEQLCREINPLHIGSRLKLVATILKNLVQLKCEAISTKEIFLFQLSKSLVQ